MSGAREYRCAAAGCEFAFPSSGAASLHYAEEHLGRGMLSSRPVSCWRCAAYIPTHRLADGTVVVPPCEECGWRPPPQWPRIVESTPKSAAGTHAEGGERQVRRFESGPSLGTRAPNDTKGKVAS